MERERPRLSVTQGSANCAEFAQLVPAQLVPAPVGLPTSDAMLLSAEAEALRLASIEGSQSEAGPLIRAAFKVPAITPIGRAAKVRMLVRHHLPELRGDLGPAGGLLRAVLAEYAGMSPADFAAV